jgi:hypothetical protein
MKLLVLLRVVSFLIFKSKLSVFLNKALKLRLVNWTITICVKLEVQFLEPIFVELHLLFINLIAIIENLRDEQL